MSFAFSAVAKVYPLEVEKSFRGSFPHCAEINVTALNTDAVLDLATLAAADAVNGPYLASLLAKADVLLNVFVLESSRAAAAATTSHTLTGTAAAPILTFAGGGTTPTVLTIVLIVKIKKDMPLVISPNQ